MMNRNKTTNKMTNSSEMNALELNAFGHSSKIMWSLVRNREIGPFGQSTRTPRTIVKGRDSELVVLGSESSRYQRLAVFLFNSATKLEVLLKY